MAHVLVIGAHPDDAEIKAGGTAWLWSQHGISATFVSVTDGGAGHHETPPEELVRQRRKEAEAAATILGAKSLCLGFPDGRLEPSLDAREAIIRLLRQTEPDLVLTHRLNDYHPDHRATAQLVQDAAYLVTVPRMAPDVPALRKSPVFGYLSDRFQKPVPFTADVMVPLDDQMIDKVIESLDAHASQFYEWLPYNMGILDTVPSDPGERKALLRQWYVTSFVRRADEWPGRGAEASNPIVEVFEISEYGSPLSADDRARLFPFPTF